MTTTNWLERLVDLARREGPTVRIVIIEVAGPTPREVGAELLVTARSAIGKIGRPAFEQNMIDLARRLITQRSGPQRGEPSPWQRRIVVDATGPVLGEVSGGELTLLFEVFGAHEIARLSELASASSIVARPLACGVPMMLDDVLAKASDASTAGSWPRVVAAAAAHLRQSPIETRILAPSPKSPTESDRWAGGWLIERTAPHAVAFYVYGSGLVARALVHALAGLPFDLIWIDTEPAHFPDGIPDHAKPLASTDPAAIAASAPTGAFHAVMTVSHDLDAAIVEALARRDVFRLRRGHRVDP